MVSADYGIRGEFRTTTGEMRITFLAQSHASKVYMILEARDLLGNCHILTVSQTTSSGVYMIPEVGSRWCLYDTRGWQPKSYYDSTL